MAAIATTDVTVVSTWYEPRQGKMTLYHAILDILLSGNGGTAADIPSTTLGFRDILSAASTRYTVTAGGALKFVPVIIEALGVGILTINLSDATDASRSSPANVVAAGTLRVYLIGIQNNP